MDAWQIGLVALAVLAVAASFWGLIYVMHFTRRTDAWINNHVPLGDNARNARLEAAMRDVDERYNVCATCGVDNAHYRIFCVLCGSPVEKVVTDGPSENERATKSSTKPRPEDSAVAPMDTLRQRRARTRRDWVRTQDSEGRFQWARSSASLGTEFPAYVVVFRRKQEYLKETAIAIDVLEPTTHGDAVCVEVEHEDDLAGATSAPPRGVNDQITFDGLPQARAKLERHLAAHEMELSLASLADPTAPVVCGDEPYEPVVEYPSISDVATMANIPFPERFAAFVAHATTIQNESGRLSLKIERANLFLESIILLAALPPHVLGCTMRLRFLEEEAIDAGGVYREWLLLFQDAIVAPETGIFRCVDRDSQVLFLNPNSHDVRGDDHLVYFLSTGRLLGRALLEGHVTGLRLALPLLKMILGQPVSFDDLEFFDPETHKNLKWLLENNGADSLGLNFTVVEQLPNGETKVVELIPGGAAIDVNDTNKHEFVERKFKYLLFESVQDQLHAFLRGVHEVVPMELLRFFDAEELDYLLAGSDEIDVEDWERHTKFSANLIDHSVRTWFWELVGAMSTEQRRRLLQFATGASRVPLAGFSALTSYDGRLYPFTLQGVELKRVAYIRSHACFNTLDLPLYRNKDQLRRMLAAILLDKSQGFTVA